MTVAIKIDESYYENCLRGLVMSLGISLEYEVVWRDTYSWWKKMYSYCDKEKLVLHADVERVWPCGYQILLGVKYHDKADKLKTLIEEEPDFRLRQVNITLFQDVVRVRYVAWNSMPLWW